MDEIIMQAAKDWWADCSVEKMIEEYSGELPEEFLRRSAMKHVRGILHCLESELDGIESDLQKLSEEARRIMDALLEQE